MFSMVRRWRRSRSKRCGDWRRSSSEAMFAARRALVSRAVRTDRCLMHQSRDGGMHGTTILTVRKAGVVVMIGDGQVTLGNLIVKPNANKLRKFDAFDVGTSRCATRAAAGR